MPECKWCGKRGVFLSVNSAGLCMNCASLISFNVKETVRIVNDSLEIIKNSKKIDTRLSRCDLIIEKVKDLLKYENKDIKTIDPKPSVFIEKIYSMKDQIIFEEINNMINELMKKDNLEISIKSKINEANKILLKIIDFKKYTRNIVILEEFENTLRKYLNETQLNMYLEEAKKAEFLGKKKTALEKYKEALYFLKTDKTEDSLQQDKIKEIESKISELSQNS
ncbi:hypothetical protein GX420_05175 [bacterium]|nr:hypothetical protein [bacterium]